MKAVKAYYTGTAPKAAFGKPLADLERNWHTHLDGFELRKEVELLLRQGAGERVRFDRFAMDPFLRLPDELRGKPKDWKDVTSARLKSTDKTTWTRDKGILRAETKSMQWIWTQVGTKALEHSAILVTFEPAERCVGVAVRFGTDGGARAADQRGGLPLPGRSAACKLAR